MKSLPSGSCHHPCGNLVAPSGLAHLSSSVSRGRDVVVVLVTNSSSLGLPIAADLAVVSVSWFPTAEGSLPLWWSRQWITATCWGSQMACRSLRIPCLFLIVFPSVVRRPLSLYIAPRIWTIAKAYREWVWMLTFQPSDRVRALISAHSSARWANHPDGSAPSSSTLSVVVTAYPA